MADFDGTSNREVSVGADIIKIERFKDLHSESPFVKRIFSNDEMLYIFSFAEPAPHLAANFAGKEAVIKTVGANDVIPYKSVEILRRANGKPYVKMFGEESDRIHVSLSHSKTHAIAVAINLSKDLQLPPATIGSMLIDAMSQLNEKE